MGANKKVPFFRKSKVSLSFIVPTSKAIWLLLIPFEYFFNFVPHKYLFVVIV